VASARGKSNSVTTLPHHQHRAITKALTAQYLFLLLDLLFITQNNAKRPVASSKTIWHASLFLGPAEQYLRPQMDLHALTYPLHVNHNHADRENPAKQSCTRVFAQSSSSTRRTPLPQDGLHDGRPDGAAPERETRRVRVPVGRGPRQPPPRL